MLSISSVIIHFHPSPPIFCIFTLAADLKLHFVGPLSWLYVLWMTSTWNATTEVTWGRLHHLWVQCANRSTLHHVAFCLTHTVCCLLNIGWFSEDPGEALESWSTTRVSKAWYSIPGWWSNWGLSLAGWKSKNCRTWPGEAHQSMIKIFWIAAFKIIFYQRINWWKQSVEIQWWDKSIASTSKRPLMT